MRVLDLRTRRWRVTVQAAIGAVAVVPPPMTSRATGAGALNGDRTGGMTPTGATAGGRDAIGGRATIGGREAI
eukprot:1160663-Alexandrium_andersonii.AAC.1